MSDLTNREQALDELLAIRCQLGERDAFDELIDRYADRLRGHVRRVAASNAEADDLVQETWLRVIRGLPGLRDPARVRSWLFGIAHRVLVDRLRTRYAEPAAVDVAPLADARNLLDEEIRRDQIERGLEVLAPIDREVVVLFYLEQFTLSEVAEAVGVPVGTVKSRLHRARRRMRAALEAAACSLPDPKGESI